MVFIETDFRKAEFTAAWNAGANLPREEVVAEAFLEAEQPDCFHPDQTASSGTASSDAS